ncbi:hypothetical protein RI065_05670 [Mycoplasmatota bacterium zrk1]
MSVLTIFVLFAFTIRFIEGYYGLTYIGVLMLLVIVSLPKLFPFVSLKKLNKVATNNQ